MISKQQLHFQLIPKFPTLLHWRKKPSSPVAVTGQRRWITRGVEPWILLFFAQLRRDGSAVTGSSQYGCCFFEQPLPLFPEKVSGRVWRGEQFFREERNEKFKITNFAARFHFVRVTTRWSFTAGGTVKSQTDSVHIFGCLGDLRNSSL